MRSLIVFLFCMIPLGGVTAQEEASDTLSTLIVGVHEAPPFIFRDQHGEWAGISRQLWDQIAGELNLRYEFRQMPLSELLDALRAGEVDLSINPLTVTSERIRHIDFTQPYFTSTSAIAVRVSEGTEWWSFLTNFFSLNFLKAILLLLFVIFVFGFVAWMFERRHNPEQFEPGWKGLWSGVWWSAVTMTTVGYGDKAPRSAGGRIVALVWMFTAIIIISGFTAAITSALTVDRLDYRIKEVTGLRDVRTGTVRASASERFLRENFIDVELFASVDEGLQRLAQGQLEAFVYDEPILRYRIERDTLEQLQVLPYRFNPQYYSFGLPKGSTLLPRMNLPLLRETETLAWRVILADFGLSER